MFLPKLDCPVEPILESTRNANPLNEIQESQRQTTKETTDFKAVECCDLKSKVFQMCKRFGMPTTFLTLSPRDVDNSRAFPASFQTVDNNSFPAVFDETSPYAKNTHLPYPISTASIQLAGSMSHKTVMRWPLLC